MQDYRYQISYNDSINRWWISEMGREPFASPYETFEAEVNLGEAYVQIVYPVRREFLKENRIHKVKKYNGNYNRVYFPFENNRVDFTTFIHTPHYIYVNAKTHLLADEDGVYPFELYTCGGMKIWVNGEEVCLFDPYTRNIPGKLLIQLKLKKGLNEILVYADELAERDVFFYYEMRYKGDSPITGVIQIDTDVEEVKGIEDFLKSVYVPKDYFDDGKLLLNMDNTLIPREMKITIEGNEDFTKLNNVKLGAGNEVTICPNTTQIELGHITDYNIGVFRIFVSCTLDSFKIRRDLIVGVIHKDVVYKEPKETIEERKLDALDFICEYGENVVNRTLAILEQEKKMTTIAYDCMINSLIKIEKKEDCADFYLPPMLYLITKYREFISDSDYNRIKMSILNFRYWIDEPGNDVMWYFSENHALLFHISQYLGGYIFQTDLFTASNHTGLEQYGIGKERLIHWFDTFFKYGYAEWNSATYIPVDLIGFFILYLMAPDKDIKELVTKALDFTFKIIAYNSYAGIMCSSYGRAYEETLKVRHLVEPNFLSWITYKEGYLTSGSRAASLYCLTDYVPPAYHEEVKLGEREWISGELDQGINQVKTYFYKTKEYFLASVRRFKPFVHGHQQHLMNVALSSRGVQLFINHPGERPYSGGNRPAYWAGNGTIPYIEQYKNTMILLYKIDPEELVHYIHGYTPFYDYDEYEISDKWLFIRVENSYIGIYFSNGVIKVEEGANTNKEVISHGLNHGIVVKCGSGDEYTDFEQFKLILKGMQIDYDGNESIRFIDPQYGLVEVNDINNVYINHAPLIFKETKDVVLERGIL